MKAIDPGDLSPRDAYELMIGAIVPRPIALVSTLSDAGIRNLSPFSFFMGVSARPPLLALSIAKTRDGEKDTMRNIRATKEFVVNVVDRKTCAAAVISSGEYAHHVDEFSVAGLEAIPSDKVAAPRVKDCPVHMECVTVELVDQPAGAAVCLVIGRVLRFHVSREIRQSDGRIDPALLDPVGRLGGPHYTPLGELFSMPRPQVDEEGLPIS
ncbi:MAG: flavin reductase family protein [Acidobacteriota bacterium]